MAKHIVPLYADLIDGMDADGRQLVADLHAFFNPAVPSRLQAAPPLVAPRAVGPKWRWPQWHWPRTALVAALAIFALVGATYVVLPLLQSLWSEDRGLQHVTQAGLARDLNLSRTINGVTVHVQKGYADANRVAIGYSVELPPTAADEGPQLSAPILTDDNGGTYRSLGFSTTGDSPLGAQLHNFEPRGVTAGRDIAFTLTIPEVIRTPKGSGNLQSFRGPWVFNFTLPMAAARVVERTQTFTRPDVELTITRIVVAPSATRVEYRVHLEGFRDREGASLMLLSGSGVGHGNNGYVTPGYVSPGPAAGSGRSFCQPDVQCSYLLREPLLDAEALHADAWISIPEYCPPRQKCEVGSDGKPLAIHIDGLVLPLR